MNKKDLLVVLNIFGISTNEEEQTLSYISSLESIFWHLDKNSLHDSVRVVVSAVISSQKCIEAIKNTFKDKISIFYYDQRYSVQVSCNKTILASIKEFNEEYEGYLYVSSGLILPEIDDLFYRMIQKNNTGEYGIMHLQTDSDQGYQWLGKRNDFNQINFMEDYDIPIGNHCNFHIALLNKQLKDFYGVPITDVHGLCCMESGLPYTSYALRKKYILLGNSECLHFTSYDSFKKMINGNMPMVGHNQPGVNCGLLWGRSRQSFANDIEGVQSGLGYYPGTIANNDIDWNGQILPHKTEKYDDNYFSNDNNLRHAVKRCYYTNENEINYNLISYSLTK
jgi:hypothetical protein